MTQVALAQPEDFTAWLVLAAEVEALFGPLVGEPGFHGALHRNIERGTALCVRQADGPPGAPLCAGMLWSPKPPLYTIGWLAVAQQYRRQGLGRRLVERALGLVSAPAEVVVTTFGEDHSAGQAARRFYERLGFQPSEAAAPGPEGGTRQIFRLRMP
jgi:ribosomal protein S18 acetylase RimI-like enzyme